MHSLLLLLLPFLLHPFPALSQDPNPGYAVDPVQSQMVQLSKHSWEHGTAAEALLEYAHPQYSVFGSNPFETAADNIWALSYVRPYISVSGEDLANGDGSAGDPASLGVFAVMLGRTHPEFREAAKRQYETLVQKTPRWEGGAISHRRSVAELWADFVYMAPPFIAYYGAIEGDGGAVYTAYEQCREYRRVLTDGQGGVWKHIVGPESPDPGRWSTGNGWAAAGMTRVLMTILKTGVANPQGGDWSGPVNDLKGWIKEILDGAMSSEKDQGLLKNYLDGTYPAFGEVSGTAILAATAYRMHTLDDGMFGDDYVKFADDARAEIGRRVDGNGIVAPAINPQNWRDDKPKWDGSPEGNAFAVLLYTAWRDCLSAGKCNQPTSRTNFMGRRSWVSWLQRND